MRTEGTWVEIAVFVFSEVDHCFLCDLMFCVEECVFAKSISQSTAIILCSPLAVLCDILP